VDHDSKEIGAPLLRWKGGDSEAIDAIFPFVYEDLGVVARQHLRRQRSNHTLQPTLCMKLMSGWRVGDPLRRKIGSTSSVLPPS
jgi:hypothetical protein